MKKEKPPALSSCPCDPHLEAFVGLIKVMVKDLKEIERDILRHPTKTEWKEIHRKFKLRLSYVQKDFSHFKSCCSFLFSE